MSQFGTRDQHSDAPKFVTSAETGETGQDQFGNTVFLASAEEVSAGDGIAAPGWQKRTVGSGGRNGRVHFETLVAFSSGAVTTDATDFANTSSSDVANTSGTADDSVLADS